MTTKGFYYTIFLDDSYTKEARKFALLQIFEMDYEANKNMISENEYKKCLTK